MISVEEAIDIILSHKQDWGEEYISLKDSVGRVLASEVIADRDFPPFDRVAMDGIAVKYSALTSGRREFIVQAQQLAGEAARTLDDEANAIEIMTGAIMCDQADVVIRYEDTEFFEQDGVKHVRVIDEATYQWKNIHRKGSDHLEGDLLIEQGVKINSGVISVLATVGMNEVKVKSLPSVAVISTGDELVEVDEEPKPFQIRKSNVKSIQAALIALNVSCELFHIQDDFDVMKQEVRSILDTYDVLLLSGAVSKGKADHLPSVLEELGVEKKFHKVAQRPGKPFWFGVSQGNKPVFAFPGNPISTYMCFSVYFLSWLKMNTGIGPGLKEVVLAEDFSFKPNLGYFLQVNLESNFEQQNVFPKPGNGSGDLANLARVDGFVYLPAGKTNFLKGERFIYYSNV